MSEIRVATVRALFTFVFTAFFSFLEKPTSRFWSLFTGVSTMAGRVRSVCGGRTFSDSPQYAGLSGYFCVLASRYMRVYSFSVDPSPRLHARLLLSRAILSRLRAVFLVKRRTFDRVRDSGRDSVSTFTCAFTALFSTVSS